MSLPNSFALADATEVLFKPHLLLLLRLRTKQLKMAAYVQARMPPAYLQPVAAPVPMAQQQQVAAPAMSYVPPVSYEYTQPASRPMYVPASGIRGRYQPRPVSYRRPSRQPVRPTAEEGLRLHG